MLKLIQASEHLPFGDLSLDTSELKHPKLFIFTLFHKYVLHIIGYLYTNTLTYFKQNHASPVKHERSCFYFCF